MTPTQELVLDCYRSPHLLRSLSDQTVPLPEGVGRVLRAALGQEPVDSDGFETVSADELRRATLLYVKRVVLVDGGDCYRSLGARADASAEQIDSNYRALIALLQTDEDESTLSLCEYVLRVSKAYAVIGDAARRRVYDRSQMSALTGDDFDLPVDAVVDEVLANGRRPYEPINSTAETETPWRLVSPSAAGGRTWSADAKDAASEADQPLPPVVPPSRLSSRMLLGVSLGAIGVIALAVPLLIARYSLLAPHWEQIQQSSESSNRLLTMPGQSGSGNADAAALLALTDPDAVAESQAVFSSQAFGPEEDTAIVVVPAPPKPKAAHEMIKPQSSEKAAGTVALVAAPVSRPSVNVPVSVAPAAEGPAVEPAPATVSTPIAAAAQVDGSPQAVTQTVPAVGVYPAELLITRTELARLVERLEAYYQDGDINQFTELFAVDARTNDRVDRVGIKEDYEQLFKSTAARQFSLSNIKWRYEDERAIGSGEFTVRITPRWKNRDEVFSGKVDLHVRWTGDGLQISGMYHDYK